MFNLEIRSTHMISNKKNKGNSIYKCAVHEAKIGGHLDF